MKKARYRNAGAIQKKLCTDSRWRQLPRMTTGAAATALAPMASSPLGMVRSRGRRPARGSCERHRTCPCCPSPRRDGRTNPTPERGTGFEPAERGYYRTVPKGEVVAEPCVKRSAPSVHRGSLINTLPREGV